MVVVTKVGFAPFFAPFFFAGRPLKPGAYHCSSFFFTRISQCVRVIDNVDYHNTQEKIFFPRATQS